MPSSKGSSQPRDWTQVFHIADRFFTVWATRETHKTKAGRVRFWSLYLKPFSSVAQSCPTLCNPMDCSTPGLPVHHQLPEFTQLMSIESVIPSSHLILCCPLLVLPPIPPPSFPMSQLFAWGGESIETSASASVLPVNIQNWFPLGLTGWISLQSKGLSRVFSNIIVQNLPHFTLLKPLACYHLREYFQFGSLYFFIF